MVLVPSELFPSLTLDYSLTCPLLGISSLGGLDPLMLDPLALLSLSIVPLSIIPPFVLSPLVLVLLA